MIGLLHPHFLWLLLVAVAMGVITYRSRREVPTRTRVLVATTRCLLLAVVVVALARPFTQAQSSRTMHVLILDVSSHVSDDELKGAINACTAMARSFSTQDVVTVLAVANRVTEVALADLTEDLTRSSFRARLAEPLYAEESPGGSAIADALQLADALVHPGDLGSVHVFTTGWQTRGDAVAAALRLGERGIILAATPILPTVDAPWILNSISIPTAAGAGQTINVDLNLSGRTPIEVDIAVRDGGDLLASRSRVRVEVSGSQLSIPVTLRQPGKRRLNMSVRPSDSATTEFVTNEARSIWVASPRRVILIDDVEQASADLQTLLGDAARVERISSVDAKAGRIEDADLIVVGDIPADSIGDDAADSLRKRVMDGAGMLFLGGTNALALGGWHESKLADVLPLRMPQELRETDPSVAVVFIIDTSGSMGTTKLELAKEVVRLALRRLQPQDKVGIVEFYGAKRWAAPLQSAANKLELNRALNRLTSGGGTEIYPAVEEASYALQNVTTRLRHVVVLTDGGVESAPFERLIRRMADANQTLSTMTIGPDASPLMESMAQWGNGRFYRVLDRMALPELLLHKPSTQTPSPVVEVPTALVADRFDDATAGLDLSQTPPLQGYVRASARPGADVLLKSASGDPILARWRVGQGRVAALTTKFGSGWSASLGGSKLAGQLVSNLGRSLYATPPGGPLAIEAVVRPAGLELKIALVAADVESATNPVRVEIRANDRIVAQKTIDALLPGSWNTLFASLRPGPYEISARIADTDLAGVGAVTIPEDSAMGYAANTSLLQEMESLNREARSRSGDETPLPRYIEWTGPLIIVAMVLLLANIFLRRRVSAQLSLAGTRSGVTRTALSGLAIIATLFALQPMARAEDISPATPPPVVESPRAQVERLRATTQVSSATASEFSALAEGQWASGDLPAACESFQRALMLEVEPSRQRSLRVKLAVALVESNRHDEAAEVLRGRMASDTAAAMLWAIYGQQDLAASQLPQPADESEALFVPMLRGSLLLGSGQAKEAGEAFKEAMALATTGREKTFIADRLIASARAAGEIDTLVNAWLSDASAAPERRLLLASILRAGDRVDDLLRLWRALPVDAIQKDEQGVQRLLAEVIGAAEEADRSGDAESLCRELWTRDPKKGTWVGALAGVLIRADRADEADEVFKRSGQAAVDGAGVLSIAKLAFAAGRDDAAITIASLANRFPAADRIDALMLQAQIDRHTGDLESAGRRLDQARDLAGTSSELLRKVGDAWEEAGDPRAAIRTYESIKDPDERALQRLAWLLREAGELTRSQDIWQGLARSASSDARRADARGRLLDLASRTGTIGEIAAELEQRLSSAKASAEDVNTLIAIYTGIRDTVSAAEVLKRSATLIGGETEVLRRLTQLYMQAEQFGLADRTLRELLKADPESAVPTLQQIAVLAIERDRPDDALVALRELAAVSGVDASSAELNAGIFDQLGMHEEAAAEYQKAVTQRPDQAETWLLWANAMKGAKKQDDAIQGLLTLAARAQTDELFSVAVDGLLNLEAPRPILRTARMLAIARLCEDPKKLIRYDLARELSDAIGDQDASMRIGELYLLVATEQRTDLLRELITVASAAGKVDKVIEYQQTLIALGDQVPPQVFLEIGRRCLVDGRLLEARRAFRRAQEVSDEEGTRLQVSQQYERAGELKLAIQALEPLVRRQENNVEARYRLAILYEQRGDFDAALDAYLACVERLVKQGDIAAGLVPARSFDEGVSKSIGDAERYLDAMLRGIVSVARTSELQQKLTLFLERIGNQTLAQSSSTGSVEPALDDVAKLVRRVSFAMHQPDIAERLDESILAKYPGDTAFLATAIASRQKVGLSVRAQAMARRHSAASSTTAIQPADPSLDEVATQIARRLIAADEEGARNLMRAVPVGRAGSPQTYPLLITAAVALNDSDAVWKWSQQWLSSATKALAGEPDVIELERCVRVSWPALSTPQRGLLKEKLMELTAIAPVSSRPRLAMLAASATLAVAGADPIDLEIASQALSDRNLRADDLATILLAVAEPERARLLEVALRQLVPERRTELLLQLASRQTVALDTRSLETIASMASMKAGAALQSVPTGIGRDATDPRIWKVLADAFVRDAADHPSLEGLTWAARASALAGDVVQADRLSHETVKLLLAGESLDAGKWTDAIESLSAEESRAMRDGLNARSNLSAAEFVLSGVLAEQLGESHSALSMYRKAFALAPREAGLRQKLIAFARENLAWQDLIEAFEPFASDPSVVDNVVKGVIGNARRELDTNFLPTVFALYANRKQAFEDPAKAEMYRFRAFQLLMRESRQWTVYAASVPTRVGGLLEYDRTVTGRQSIYQALAGESWAADEYLAVFRATPPGATETEGIALGIASMPKSEIERVREALSQAERDDALTANDRTLLLAMVGAGHEIGAELAKALDESIDQVPSDDFKKLAGIRSAKGDIADPHSPADRYVAAAGMILRNAGDVNAFPAPLDTRYLTKPFLEWNPGLFRGPAPSSRIDDATEAPRLAAVCDADPKIAADAVAESLRRGWMPVSSFPRSTLVAARIAYETGDETAFIGRVQSVLAATRGRSYQRVPDLALAMPAGDGRATSAALKKVIALIEHRVGENPWERNDLIRALSLLGRWAAQHGLLQEAQACLEQALRFSSEPGEQDLWILDLANELGRDVEVQSLAQRLDATHQLPAKRRFSNSRE